MASQPLLEYQHLPLVENQQDQQMGSFLGFSQPCRRKQLNRCNGRSSWYFPDVEGCDNEEEEDACIFYVRLRQLGHYLLKIGLSFPILPSWLHQPGGGYWAHGNLSKSVQNLRCWKQICPFCHQTFEKYDKIKKHIGIHIMSLETCMICLNNINNQG